MIVASSIRTGTPVSGLLPEGFGFGVPAPPLPESALFQSVSTIAAQPHRRSPSRAQPHQEPVHHAVSVPDRGQDNAGCRPTKPLQELASVSGIIGTPTQAVEDELEHMVSTLVRLGLLDVR